LRIPDFARCGSLTARNSEIGGLIVLSTVGHDRSIVNCVTAILTVGLMHRLLAGIKANFPRFGAVIDGSP
jgi:uncharacterized membrane protein YcaP (DUF421 family)